MVSGIGERKGSPRPKGVSRRNLSGFFEKRADFLHQRIHQIAVEPPALEAQQNALVILHPADGDPGGGVERVRPVPARGRRAAAGTATAAAVACGRVERAEDGVDLGPFGLGIGGGCRSRAARSRASAPARRPWARLSPRFSVRASGKASISPSSSKIIAKERTLERLALDAVA